MRRFDFNTGLFLLGSTLLAGLLFAQPTQVFNDYLDALLRSEPLRAESHWIQEEIEKSRRLGIEFTRIEAKYDCASPVIENLDMIRNGQIEVVTGQPVYHETWIELPVKLVQDSSSVSTVYYLVKRGDTWKLSAPLFIFTENWNTITTDYVSLHYSDSTLVNSYALQKLDWFIDTLGVQLNLSIPDKEHLKKARLHYYLCNEEEIELLTGFPAQGMTNLQFDAVISRQLPHYHELSHFMVNYSMRRLPLYTLPCLQEGLACYLGGRWGKTPELILYAGYYTCELGLTSLEEVLTYDGFHRQVGMPDITYPVSALLVKTMIDNTGMDKFHEFYLDMSGTSREVISLGKRRIQSRISNFSNASWVDFTNMFKTTTKGYKYCGIIPGAPTEETEPILDISSGSMTVSISETDEQYCFRINGMEQVGSGAVLLSDSSLAVEGSYQSWMFTEQNPDHEYCGEIFGIRFSSTDVGLYNYLDNTLSAKYIHSFLPSDEYWIPGEMTLTFCLQKSALPDRLMNYKLQLVR